MPVLHINDECVPCSGILFDKDGTLLDLLATWGNWAELVLRGLEDQLAIMGAGFIVERSKVLGTQHDPQGKLIGYEPGGAAYYGYRGRKLRCTRVAAICSRSSLE